MNRKVSVLLKNSNKHIAIVAPLGYNGILFSRALFKKKIPVIGIFSSKEECFYHTNSCEKVLCQDIQGVGLIKLLLKIGKIAKKKPVLLPVADLNVLLFSQYRKQLAQYFLFNIPDKKIIDILVDKTEFYKWGHKKFLYPQTFIINSERDLALVLKDVAFPIIFKPKYRNAAWLSLHLPKASIFNDEQEVITFYNEVKNIEGDFLISEFIPGGDSSIETCHVYYRDGKLLASYTDQKIRQDPPLTGTGTFISSCHNPKIKDITVKIFDKFRYTGIGGHGI